VKLLDRLLDHLRDHPAHLATEGSGEAASCELQAATAALLLEAAYGDAEILRSEEDALLKGLEREFGIGFEEALQVLDRAEAIRPPAVKLDDLIEVLRDRYDETQRRQIVALLWRVVRADDVVREWEQAFVNHVAEVLGIPSDEARRPA
jgi:uncharacterized tellurite resistance protein B-like protein